MRFIFRSVSGSFLRTIGRIFAYILIGAAIAYFSGFINLSNVSAATVNAHDVTINRSGLPTVLSVSTTGNRFLLDASIRSAYFDYKYAILTICSNIGFDVNVYNPSYNYYFNDESYLSNTGKTCTTQGYSGTSYNLYLSVGKFDIGNGNSSYYLVSSYLDFKSTWGYNGYLTVQDFVFSNEDYSISAQKDDKINSSINDVNNSINSDDSDTTSSKCGVICKLKGIFTGIIELPGKLVTLLIDGLKALFIPKNMDFINNLVDSLENKLGLIAEVPIQCIEFILNLANATWTEFKSVNLPSISIFGYNFWNAQEIDLSEGIKIFSTFKYVTDVICVVICVKTLFKWYEGFTGG